MSSAALRWTVLRLGTAQTLAWASSYYLPALLAAPMAEGLGVPVALVFAGFSAALVVSALCAPLAGHAIDRHGGRPVLLGSNVLFALGLAALAGAQGPAGLFLAWGLIGMAMGAGLYEAAFAALVRLYGQDARGAITGITLIAGFASTVGWPLTAWMQAHWGWRGTCLGWAALHLLLGLPLNAWLPRAPVHRHAPPPRPATAGSTAAPGAAHLPGPQPAPALARRMAWLLAFVFAATWFTSTAMAAHLPRLLQASGMALPVAVGVAALVGPAQVVARLLEYGLLHRMHPLHAARLAALAHPLGALLLCATGGGAGLVFTLLHGAGNGILTIAKGTLPLVLFGAHGYGLRQGLLMVPARVAQAGAPLLFGLLLDRAGTAALGATALLGLASAAALWALRPAAPAPG